MSEAYPSPPKNGMLSAVKTWLQEQDITGAKAWAKKQGQLQAEETARKQQAAQDWADVTIGESEGGPFMQGAFYSPLSKKWIDVGDVMSPEEKQSAVSEAYSRQLARKANESFERARKMREQDRSVALGEQDGSVALGFDSDFYKNLTKGQQEGYNVLANTLGEEDLKLANKIPIKLLPQFFQQVPQMRKSSTPEQMREFVVATINNGESFLDENQKWLSKQKAKSESLDREEEFQAKLDAQKKQLEEERQKIERAKSAHAQSAIEQVRSEYAGMTPDQIISHYHSKYGQPKYSNKQAQAAVNRMDDETDQMAAARLGRKYSKSKGLY